MPGAFAHDALAANLATGATLNAAGTTTGTIVELGWFGAARCHIKTGTVTGTTPTLQVELEASDSLTFASGVVSLGFSDALAGTGAAQSNGNRFFTVDCQKRYIRANVILGGTDPVYTGTVVEIVPLRWRRSDTDTA